MVAAACGPSNTTDRVETAQLAARSEAAGRRLTGSALLPKQLAGVEPPVYALVELTERPAASQYRARLGDGSVTTMAGTDATETARAAGIEQLRVVQREHEVFAARVRAERLPTTSEVYRLGRVFNGILYATRSADVARLRALPGVRAVHILKPRTYDNWVSVPFIGVQQLWSAGVPFHGENIRVGVIDTGIDYTHANFGGPGTAAAFAANDPSIVEPGTFPTAKVVGGWDFAGADYDAGSPDTAQPRPDADPLDESGHGSHVSGTIAGFGVNTNGTPFGGVYDANLDPTKLRIGPGAAPRALLYALKVFGDNGGSTMLDPLAMEWATDPNGDGDFSDHLDVVNLSLGSSYGNSANAEATIYANAVNAGVVVVASAGNSADVYFITGAPASTPAVISVAATATGEAAALRVDSPSDLAGMKAAGIAEFGPTLSTPLSGTVALGGAVGDPSTLTACNAVDPAVSGKIAIVRRGTCTFLVKTQNAAAAGAIGVVIVNSVTGPPIGMAGVDPTLQITARMVSKADGDAIIAKLQANPPVAVTVTLDDSLWFVDSTMTDTVASFSSRGPSRVHGQPILKPDVAAPGDNILSTAMGTGSLGTSMSGTSMAAPLTTGMMALLKQMHPSWTPAELKALAMNTANHDLFNVGLDVAGRSRVSPVRVGGGRIDAAAANGSSVVAFDNAAPERVSLSFATTDVVGTATEPRKITLRNKGSVDVVYDVTMDGVVQPPGTQVAAGATSVTVTAGSTVDLPVTLTATASSMLRRRDPTVSSTATTAFGTLSRHWLSEASGYVVLTPRNGGSVLRVPYFAALTPAASMSASGPLATTGATGAGSLTLTGTDVNNVASGTDSGVKSLVTPFELAYASPKAPPIGGALPPGYAVNESDPTNLRYVGVTSNLADLVPLGYTVADAEIYFGIGTWGFWGSPNEVQFEIALRPAGASSWQWVLYHSDAGPATGAAYTDVQFTILENLTTGNAFAEDFVNGLSPSRVPLFLTDAMVLPVYVSDLFPNGGNTELEYKVIAYSLELGIKVDESPILRYDLQHPAFATTLDAAGTGLTAGYPPVRYDTAGAFSVSYDLNRARTTQTGSVLLLHHHNAAGSRSEAVSVSGLTCTGASSCTDPARPVCDTASGACVQCVSNTDCPGGLTCDVFGTRTCSRVGGDCRVGAPACAAHQSCNLTSGTCESVPSLLAVGKAPLSSCPAGGIAVDTGYDDDQSGVLDPIEILATSYVCNGVAGADGQSASVTTEPAGANCAVGGVKVQVGSGTATYVCNGATGATGASGQSATVVPEAAGSNCAAGGVKVQVGSGTATYVCNGAAGADGQSATVTPEAAGANCATGGLKVQVGSGTAAYVCDGTNGQSATVTPEASGSHCAAGGLKVQVGSGTPSFVCNGTTGSTGAVGPTGPVGPKGCSTGGGAGPMGLLLLAAWRVSRRRRPAVVSAE